MLYRILLIAFLLFGFACQNAEKQSEQTKQNQTETESEPIDLAEFEKKDSTLILLNQEIRKNINDASLFIQRAEYYIARADLLSAKADLERAYFIDTTALEPLLAFSDFWLKNGKLGHTLTVLEKAEQYHPESSKVQAKFSELYLFAKDNKKSMSYADLAVRYDPFNARAYYLKGFNFLELGDTAMAISSYQTAVEQDPDFYDAYLELGLLYASMDNDLAIQYYDNALSIRPGEFKVLYSKGLYYQEHELYNEAIQTYFEATKRFPNFKEAYFNLGYVHMYYLKLYREATLYFTDAIEVDPNYFQAYYNRGYSFELMGDVQNAKRDYQKALQIQPSYTMAAEGITRINQVMDL